MEKGKTTHGLRTFWWSDTTKRLTQPSRTRSRVPHFSMPLRRLPQLHLTDWGGKPTHRMWYL